MDPKNIRNIAIIAHVDHGKTTLVDAFLKQTNVFRSNSEEMQQEMILDSGDLEREKGITITAKNISVLYTKDGQDYKINIIDTPGHADFGGEVERTLNMASGALLLVDAQEGPKPQTKFVLKKALELGLKLVVVVNKIDKQFADPARAVDQVSDLFLTLASTDEQLNFPVYYAIGREGKAFKELPADAANTPGADIRPLLDAIIDDIPAPTGDTSGKLQMQITSLEFDQHLGRMIIGKINRGVAKNGDAVNVITSSDPGAPVITGRIKKLMLRRGIPWEEVESAGVGEIVGLIGVETTAIGGTVCATGTNDPLPTIKISDPSVQVRIEANTSPMLGKEGKFVTAKQIQQRLDKEAETNISLKIAKTDSGAYSVAGRGELQLAILIETLRREGYEFQVRRPEVIMKEVDGVLSEPMEELYVEVPEEFQGAVTAALSERRAEMLDMYLDHGQAIFTYKIHTRNLLGLRQHLLTNTKGNLVIHNFLLGYVPYVKQPELYRAGVLVASEAGVSAEYALNTIQERGELFIPGSTQVYEGMIIGIHKYENDLDVNCTKEREKSGVRRNQAEITQVALRPLKRLSLEFALLFLAEDEMLEVTPLNLRLRKTYLTKTERDFARRKNLSDFAKSQMGGK